MMDGPPSPARTIRCAELADAASAFAQSGHWAQALTKFKEVLGQPDVIYARLGGFFHGLCRSAMFRESEIVFRMIAGHPTCASHAPYLSDWKSYFAYLAKDPWQSAERCRQALAADPKNPRLNANLAVASWASGQFQMAEAALNAAREAGTVSLRIEYLGLVLERARGANGRRDTTPEPREVDHGKLICLFSPPLENSVEMFEGPVSPAPERGWSFSFPDSKAAGTLFTGQPMIAALWNDHGLYLETGSVGAITRQPEGIRFDPDERFLVQRREAVRIIARGFAFAEACRGEDPSGPRAARALTVSASGISMDADSSWVLGDTLKLKLEVGNEPFAFNGIVRRISRSERGAVAGISFSADRMVRDRLAQRIHHRQIELRKIHERAAR